MCDGCGMDVGSIWDPCGISAGSVWDQCGISVGSMWDRCGINVELKSIWDKLSITNYFKKGKLG